ncbi:MAG: hypothetical protein IGS48_20630 [Oscillatoriales cyanobacterium C42_A2020_001]|nr:hypothetical protein [Leptolyngbyaceae cyanobacterium C42_A2020_001]
MRQSSTAQSPTQAAQPSPHGVTEKRALHPVLQNALTHCDVQLEDELVRYRRQRALGRAFYQPRPPAYKKVSTALELMPVDVPPEPLPTPSSSGFHPTASVAPLAEIAIASSNELESSGYPELKQLARQYATQVADESDLAAALHNGPDDYLESSEELLRALSQEEANVQAEQGFMRSLLTPLGVGSMLLMLMSSAMFGFVMMNPSSVSRLFNRSDTRNPTTAIAPEANSSNLPQPNLADQEFPELSLGTLGSIPLDEGAIAPGGIHSPPAKPSANSKVTKPVNLGVSRLAGGANSANSGPVVPSAPQMNEPAAEPAPPAGDVPSPRKLAPSSGSVSAPIAPYNPAPSRSYNPQPSRSYKAPVKSSIPPVRISNPPPRLRPLPTAPANNPVSNSLGDRTPPPPSSTVNAAPSKPSNYKVVTPYTSDSALHEARQKVPDAYVKNYSDGAKVQFGAYQDEATAKSQAEELRKQGIPAEVYKP